MESGHHQIARRAARWTAHRSQIPRRTPAHVACARVVSGVYLGYNDVSDLDFNSEISFLTNFLPLVSSLSLQVCGAVQSGPTGVFATTPRHSYLHHQFGPEQC